MSDLSMQHPYNSGLSHFLDAFPQREQRSEDIQRMETSRILTMLAKQNKQEKQERSGENGA